MSKRIGLLTALLVLAFPALASAKIVVNKSIAGVSLGESKAAVRHHLGAPGKVMTGSPTDWVYPGRKLLVGLKNGRVVEVFTESRAQKTASGMGVGSTESAVKAHISGVKCQHVKGFSGQECITVSKRTATTEWTTDFHIGIHGHVASVLVNILNIGGAVDRAFAHIRF